MQNLRKALQDTWRPLEAQSIDKLLEKRFVRLMGYGRFKEVAEK